MNVAGNDGYNATRERSRSPEKSAAQSVQTRTSENSTIRTEKTQREVELEEELEEIRAAKEAMDEKLIATEEKLEDLTEKLE